MDLCITFCYFVRNHSKIGVVFNEGEIVPRCHQLAYSGGKTGDMVDKAIFQWGHVHQSEEEMLESAEKKKKMDEMIRRKSLRLQAVNMTKLVDENDPAIDTEIAKLCETLKNLPIDIQIN